MHLPFFRSTWRQQIEQLYIELAPALISYEAEPAPPATVLQLQVADHKGDLDAALDRSAEQILPTASHPNSALNALSKE